MRKTGALTLVETLLSLGLVAAVLITVISVLLTGLRSTEFKQQNYVATDLGKQLLERSKSLGGLPSGTHSFSGSAGTPTLGGFPPAPYPSADVDGRHYTLDVSISPFGGRADVHLVQVTVSWGGHRVALESALYAF